MNIEEQVNGEIMTLQNRIWARDGMPAEVIKIVESIRDRLIDISNEQKIDLSRTYGYVESQFGVLDNFLKTRMGENRKSQKMGDIINEVKIIHKKVRDKFDKYYIEQREKEDKKESLQITAKVLMNVNNLVENIYTSQKRMLNAQGYDQNDIEKTMYEIKHMIQKYMSNTCKGKIENAFILDNAQIRELQKETISNINRIKQKDEKDEGKFRKELKLNSPTLEEQKKDAAKRSIDQGKKETEKGISEENSLPSDVLK